MGSRAENVSQRLRSRSTSRGRSDSAGRSPSHRRSKSPARSKAVSEKRAGTPPRSTQGRKSLPKTPQISPSRHSQRLVEKTLVMSLPEQNGRKMFVDSDVRSVIVPRRISDASGDYEPLDVQEEPEEIQVLRPEPLQPQKELPRHSGGGILGLALMALLPAVALSVALSCSPRSCNLRHYPSIPRDLSAYLDMEVAVVLAGWLVFQFIIALVPVGGIRLGQPLQPDGRRLKYRCNGLFALAANSLAIGLLQFYYKYPVHRWLSQKFLPLTVTASLFALLLSIWAFLRARSLPRKQLSSLGQNGNFFNDFYMGRELNPRIRGVDLKLFFIVNVGLIGWATVESLTLVEAFQKDLWSGALLLVAGFQSIYLLDALLFQGSFATTATALNDGLGFKIEFASLVWQPLVNSILVRYLLLHPRTFCLLTALSSTILFLIGYVIYRWSSIQKDLFRQSSHDPAFSAWKTLSSSTGRPLLCTFKWWRICRHPNYLGNLLMVIAWSLPCGFSCPLSYAFPLVMLLTFVVRIHDVEAVCHKNHGAAWNQYAQKVTSRLIPWIC